MCLSSATLKCCRPRPGRFQSRWRMRACSPRSSGGPASLLSSTTISDRDFQRRRRFRCWPRSWAKFRRTFSFDHIGIGMLDHGTKEIEIKAEAGTTAQALGKRIPLGAGILGRVARTGRAGPGAKRARKDNSAAYLPDSRAVLCIPITYSESLLGVLNVESRNENAFSPQDVLILNTLADLLATALHNAFVFQKLQQQSITDGLDRHQDTALLLGGAEFRMETRVPFRTAILGGADRSGQIQGGQRHHRALEGDLVLARVGRLLEQKSGSRTWWPATAAMSSSS